MTPSTTTPGPGAPPVNRRHGWGMTQSLPLSYWSPEKSYMTSSHTATLIYISARFRVNGGSKCRFFILNIDFWLHETQIDIHQHAQISASAKHWFFKLSSLCACSSSKERMHTVIHISCRVDNIKLSTLALNRACNCFASKVATEKKSVNIYSRSKKTLLYHSWQLILTAMYIFDVVCVTGLTDCTHWTVGGGGGARPAPPKQSKDKDK